MKLRRRFVPHQLLFLIGAACVSHAVAQDRVILKDGTVRETKVLGANATTVQVQNAKGMEGISLATVAEVVMPPPAEFKTAIAAYAAKTFPEALAAAKTVVAKYPAFPSDWATQAAALVGDIYVAMQKIPEAEAAYRDFLKMYPGAMRAEINAARVSLAKNDAQTARQKLEPITARAEKEQEVTRGDGATYGNAFLLLGQVDEAAGNTPKALEDYLKTVTLFYHDPSAAREAQQRAEVLKQRGVMVP